MASAGTSAGSQTTAGQPEAFRYYQLDPSALRDPARAYGVQLSVFEVLAGGEPVAAVSVSEAISDSPGNETAINLIDGRTSTKWLSRAKTANTVTIDLGESVVVDGYRWATANDHTDRDPISWRVRGSNDGTTFTTLDQQSEYETTTTRQRFLPVFELAGAPDAPDPEDPAPDPSPAPDPDPALPAGDRLLYSSADIANFRQRMDGSGAFYSRGDAGHGGQYSPGDGERAEALARSFLQDPGASYWKQNDLPYVPWVSYPSGMTYARPMHAAWVVMTQPQHPDRGALQREVKKLLLTQANDPTLDFSDSSKYPVNFHGAALGPIFHHAQWMSRTIKARDMLGRDAFTAAENAAFDRWIFGYANWSAQWLHREAYGKSLPGRTDRDYSTVRFTSGGNRSSYDGGPKISYAAMAYTNRHASVASGMSLAVNYAKHYGHDGSTRSRPGYGVWSVDQVVDHSRLFVEETLRFSVYPQGVQGDFERGDNNHHNASAQQGWLYSANVLNNLVEIAEYHAKRGDMSVWDFGTTAGHEGSAGVPVAGGFEAKSVHFFAWSMSRYANNGWGRTNRGEPLVKANFYHDVIPAAIAHRFAPDDRLLEAAWKRSGQGFSPYPQSLQSQGPFPAHHGEGGKMIGLIEHGGAPPISNR